MSRVESLVAGSSTGLPSPASCDPDSVPAPSKRPRLRSTKSELFLVNSEPSRDTSGADSSNDAPPVGVSRTVTALVAAVSDDSVDSSVADVSQNSITDVSVLSTEDAVCKPAAEAAVNDRSSSADIQASVVEVLSVCCHNCQSIARPCQDVTMSHNEFMSAALKLCSCYAVVHRRFHFDMVCS